MYLNNYQSFTFGAIIIGLLSFVACEKTAETQKIIGFGIKTELAQTESIWFGSDTLTGLKVRVIEIADSRCPNDPNVQCVWAGEAKVKFTATHNTDSVGFDLKISPTENPETDTVSFKLNSKNYQAILYAVNPKPTANNNQGAKFATFTILNNN